MKKYFWLVIDKRFIAVISVIALFIMRLNYNAIAMKGVIPYYLDLKDMILSGFTANSTALGTPTFPLWGYSWLFILTENKSFLLLLQNALAVFSIWVLLKIAEKGQSLSLLQIRLFKLILFASLPFYAYHSVLWPNSISTSLFFISFMLFLYHFLTEKGKYISLIVSGSLFGLALNFRSDLLLLPLVFVLVLLFVVRDRLKLFLSSTLWLVLIFLMVLPWGIYTKKETGHFLLTSTNGGVHFFCGLGNMPGNKWGITYDDGDPKAAEILKKSFGDRYFDNIYLTYEGNEVLKKEFFRLVRVHPFEYFKKSMYTLYKIVKNGPYAGEFYEKDRYSMNDKQEYRRTRDSMFLDPLRFDYSKLTLTYVIQIISSSVGVLLYFLSYLLLPLTMTRAVCERNVFFIFIAIGIIYQTLLNMLGGYLSSYVSSMYLLHVINLVFALSILKGYLLRQKGESHG